jgi:hypothetical protein
MPPKKNPLCLNALQLKTLTLFQATAALDDHAEPAADEPGAVLITTLPRPHGDHFHLGDAVVASRDATGLTNPSVWTALARKGLIRATGPAGSVVVTAAGLAYETGLGALLHRADH